MVEQSWARAADGESLFGGGEYQNGLVGLRGAPIQLVQFNTEAAVPFFSSTKGYGLLWDSNAWTHLNPPTGQPLTFNYATCRIPDHVVKVRQLPQAAPLLEFENSNLHPR